jgi:hypothetical protein
VAFTPASSLSPATVTVAGVVSVSNFPASQPVTGPLTDAELRAAAVPVSVASLPLPSGAATEATLETLATEDTLAAANGALNDVALTAILEREKLEA